MQGLRNTRMNYLRRLKTNGSHKNGKSNVKQNSADFDLTGKPTLFGAPMWTNNCYMQNQLILVLD